MKKNLDNFDNLVKNKLDGLEFPFNESNWEKASQMIDATRPAKKPIANLLMISSVLLTGALIIGAAYFFSSQSNGADDKKLAQNKTLTQENNNASLSPEMNAQPISNSSEEKNTDALAKNTNENNALPTQQTKIETLTNSSSSKENSGKSSQLAVGSGQSAVSSTQLAGNNKQSTIGSRNNANTSSFTKQNKQNALTLIGREENAKLKTKPSDDEIAKNENSVSSNNTPVYKPLEKNNTETANETKAIQISDANKPNEEEKELTGVTPPAAILQPDTSTSEFARKKDYVKMRHHTLTAEAGAINSFGWKANDVRNGNSVSPLLGINYMYSFTAKSSVLVGLQYNSLANLSESNVSFSVTSFDFGMNNEVTTYKITGLQYIVAPIKYIHKLNKNNAIGIGLNMTYLMNVKNKIETYKTIESNVQTTESRNDNGYGFDYLNRYNVQIALSYSHKLTKTLGFNVELNQTLKNTFKDYSYFGVSNKNSKAAALKLSLTYTLFNK